MQPPINGFIDIHSHLLPVQDGPKDMNQAIQALKLAEESNITDMILTPHYYSGDKDYDQKFIFNTFESLKAEIQKNGLKIRVYLGNECIVDDKLVEDLQAGKAFTLNNTKYVLCEYPLYQVPCNFQSNIYDLMDKGYRPVIAHAERNAFIDKNYGSIHELAENGCLIQRNVGSYLNKYGPLARKYAKMMLKHKKVSLFATDAHSIKKRSPEIYLRLYKKLKLRISKECMIELFDKNTKIFI